MMPSWVGSNAGDRYSSMSGEQRSLAKTTLGDTQNQKLDAYAAGHPPVWTDVTSAHISKLHMACKEHIMFTYKLAGDSKDPRHAANLPYPETQRNKNLLKPMAELMKFPANRIVCAEKSMSDDARTAFAVTMGKRYFPPHIVGNQTNSHHTVRVSCGGPNLYLDHYGGFDSVDNIKRDGRSPTDAYGNPVKDTVGMFKADGGSWGSRPVSWNNGRRRGTVLPEAQFFRTALSDTSNTCCPPLNVPYNGYSSTQITPLRLFFARQDKSPEMCFRKLFFKHERNGNLKPRNDADWLRMQQHCESEMELQVLECASCDCRTAKEKAANAPRDLIKIRIQNTLLSANDACKPWFTMMDSAMKMLIGAIRAKINKEKVKKCE